MDAPLGRAETDELERLRRRAYGPNADIAGDAAAQLRLSDLEAARRRQPSVVADAAARTSVPVAERVPAAERLEGPHPASTSPGPVNRASTEHDPSRRSVTEPGPVEGRAADSGPIDVAPWAPWWRRRRWLAILGGATAALVLDAALVVWISQLLADRSTPIPADTSTAEISPLPDAEGRAATVRPPDHVLALQSVGAAADVPKDSHGTLDLLGLTPDKLGRYEDFRSLSVWSGESRFGTTCLLVARSDQGLREGIGTEGCFADGLDPVADLVHPENIGFSTGSVFVGLPTGSLIRFVLKGDHVDVYMFVRAGPIAPER
jgi:hypothetical protein